MRTVSDQFNVRRQRVSTWLNFKILNSKSRLLVAEQATNNSKSIQGSQVLLNKYYLIFACFL